MPVEHAHEMAHALDVAVDVAPVGVLGDEAQRLALPAPADQDRDVTADRLGDVEGVADAVVLALVRSPRGS